MSIEEASSKRILLLQIPEEHRLHIRDPQFGARIAARKISLSENPILSPCAPPRPERVYVTENPEVVRAKWAETHTNVKVDPVRSRFVRTKTTKSIILIAGRADGIVQLRLDKPEIVHSHRNDLGEPESELYYAFYLARATELLGASLAPLELRNALRSLVEIAPRVVRIESKDIRTAANSRYRISSKTDIRDDNDWKAMHAAGGENWSYDSEMVYWLPNASNVRLTREVFTEIDGRRGRLRMDADCHENEIEYAISKIAEHQRRAP